ncbi:MAG: alpha/beta hydrolase family protein [Candidatus Hodarchaeota archaeon]
MKITKFPKRKRDFNPAHALIFLSLFFGLSLYFLTEAQPNPIGASSGIQGNAILPSTMFNATEFWISERAHVEGFSLNLLNHSETVIEKLGRNFTMTELSYDSPNWVGASPSTLRINATLIKPVNESGSLGLLPGVALFTGIGDRRQIYFENQIYAYSISNLNCAVLVPDHPGLGESEGPAPSPENMFYQGDFNKTAHPYLVFCAALQGIRVLENLSSFVNDSKLAITGFSYGGWTSQVISGIYSDKINLSLPYGATGDFEKAFQQPESFWHGIVDKTNDEALAWLVTHKYEIDPTYLMNNADYPETLWGVSTNDEFFHYSAINGTYNVVTGINPKHLQINPNGHHIPPPVEISLYMLNYAFFNGPAPPNITILEARGDGNVIYEKFNIRVNVDCDAAISSVEICFDYKDLFGLPWKRQSLAEVNGASGEWTGSVEPSWFNSKIEYFVIVTLATGGKVWFTSQIFLGPALSNPFSYLLAVGIAIGVGMLVVLILRFRYKNEVLQVDDRNKKNAKKHFLIENSLIAGTEAVKYISLFLPWLVLSRTVSFSHLFIQDALFTFTELLGDLAHYINGIIFTLFILFGLVALIKPNLGGFLNLLWPSFLILVGILFIPLIGGIPDLNLLGIGPIVFISISVAQMVTWFWKRKYHKKLNIPKKNLRIILKGLKKSRK